MPGLPASRWKRLETSSVQERISRETRRRSRVVQVFPSMKSLERLVGAVMGEQDEGGGRIALLLGAEDGRSLRFQPSPEQDAPEEREKADEMARKAM
jgi:putative transposase